MLSLTHFNVLLFGSVVRCWQVNQNFPAISTHAHNIKSKDQELHDTTKYSHPSHKLNDQQHYAHKHHHQGFLLICPLALVLLLVHYCPYSPISSTVLLPPPLLLLPPSFSFFALDLSYTRSCCMLHSLFSHLDGMCLRDAIQCNRTDNKKKRKAKKGRGKENANGSIRHTRRERVQVGREKMEYGTSVYVL